jgi:hypothetical protein
MRGRTTLVEPMDLLFIPTVMARLDRAISCLRGMSRMGMAQSSRAMTEVAGWRAVLTGPKP